MSKHQMKQRADMPKAAEVRSFWAYKLRALGKITDVEDVLDPVVTDWPRATEADVAEIRARGVWTPEHDDPRRGVVLKHWQCFCCGKPADLDRAHIHALALGGTNHVSNLHMLCRSCHTESEEFHGERYWRWFLSKLHLPSMHPDHCTKIYAALGAKDIHHVAKLAIERYGTCPVAVMDGVQEMLRDTQCQR
jgi:hypothetical protein